MVLWCHSTHPLDFIDKSICSNFTRKYLQGRKLSRLNVTDLPSWPSGAFDHELLRLEDMSQDSGSLSVVLYARTKIQRYSSNEELMMNVLNFLATCFLKIANL